jgi:tRNA threonylcarbamoyladenosine biosynthesis protein TsaE
MAEIVHLSTLDDTQLLAQKLAQQAKPGDVFTLSGDLGAGKTAFARCFVQALCGAGTNVGSPTFNLLQTYPLPGEAHEVWHYDLYRIEHRSALIELGLDEALRHITLIEWPDRLGDDAMPIAVALTFTLLPDGTRTVIVE